MHVVWVKFFGVVSLKCHDSAPHPNSGGDSTGRAELEDSKSTKQPKIDFSWQMLSFLNLMTQVGAFT